jgi:hypothetical protein
MKMTGRQNSRLVKSFLCSATWDHDVADDCGEAPERMLSCTMPSLLNADSQPLPRPNVVPIQLCAAGLP